jgi:hypothetical protein
MWVAVLPVERMGRFVEGAYSGPEPEGVPHTPSDSISLTSHITVEGVGLLTVGYRLTV